MPNEEVVDMTQEPLKERLTRLEKVTAILAHHMIRAGIVGVPVTRDKVQQFIDQIAKEHQ